MNRSLSLIIKDIGLTSKHAVVYKSLISLPHATPLQLARATKLNRSSLYRYLEELREKGLVEIIMADKSTRYRANPEGFNLYLAKEESRIEILKTRIPPLVTQLSTLNPEKAPGTEVKYYQGVEGLKQMLWNVVQTKSEFVGLGIANWNTSVGKSYAEKLRRIMLENNIVSREISNDPDDSFSYTSLGDTYQNVYSHRRINPKILQIKHDTYIYDDVFAFYYHYKGELLGVEIHNYEISKTERQMFEILWKIAESNQ